MEAVKTTTGEKEKKEKRPDAECGVNVMKKYSFRER